MYDSANKKPLLAVFVVSIVLGTGFFAWRLMQKEGGRGPNEEEIAKEKLTAVEKQIAETEVRLGELQGLTFEEKEKRKKEREALSARGISDDAAVSGVEIIILKDKKIVSNIAQGYTIEVPLHLIVARSVSSDWIEFHDRTLMCQDPSCDPVMRIRAEERNPRALSLEAWFKEEEKKADAPLYSPREEIELTGKKLFKITESIPFLFDGFYYYWAKGKKIYSFRISQFDEELYRAYVATLAF